MKKIIAIMLALILTVSVLASCTKQPAEPDVTDDQTDVTDVDTPDTDSTDGAADESDKQDDITPADHDEIADPDAADTEESEDEKFEIANTLIDHPVSELIEAIGEPLESAYASSCMGGGQDGELYYREFTVVTYLENGSETVVDVYSTK